MDTISFARGVPAPECLPVSELADCARTVLQRDGKTVLSYGSAAGYLPLRELIASWFKVEVERVMITNGALQGFVFLAQRHWGSKVVLVESPTYDRPLKILIENGLKVQPVMMDEHGLSTGALEEALRRYPRPAFLYTIPTFQNPSGRTMPTHRREEIVALAQARGLQIFEDDPYGLIRFEGEMPPALFDLSRSSTIYTSSFSKTIAPGLRVGFYIFPPELAPQVIEQAGSTYITPVLLGQAIVHEFISRGSFEPNLKRVTELLRVRRDAMLSALERHLPGATWSRPEGGYFIWLELEPGTNAKAVLDRAQGVSAVLGSDFGGKPNTLRLAYSYVSPEEIETGIERLAAAVEGRVLEDDDENVGDDSDGDGVAGGEAEADSTLDGALVGDDLPLEAAADGSPLDA
jgi:2-aminoadipate transaminase